MPTTLELRHVGPIVEAKVEFGDLTVLVGPQASGKSIFLQFFKLLQDTGSVLADLKRHGLDWERNLAAFLDVFLGEGMHGVWDGKRSRIRLDDVPVEMASLVARQRKSKTETVFFVPAQRVLTLGRGWPRPFSDYNPGDPFVVRDFSEKLRLLMEEKVFGASESLFPQPNRLKQEIRDVLSKTVFANFGLRIDLHGAQKRLVLNPPDRKDVPDGQLPFMVWSAGQREFVPLLLGVYWLCPPTKVTRREKLRWVVIEELEMGLHPQAISAVMVVVLELLNRGYRVILSTHSSQVLDVVWALRTIASCGCDAEATTSVLDLFALRNKPATRELADTSLRKTLRVYFFDRDSGKSKEISDLDPGSDDPGIAGWGGLSEFAGRAGDIVAKVVEESGARRGEAP